ncbi:MAG: K(+)-transporting ATPase subunit F [Bacteroidetes bacterium]|nr:K(+)-transporting ATPase subunit F [Bacteroidota bacterium]
MKSILSILLVVPNRIPAQNTPLEMNSAGWMAAGAIIALLLMIYLVITLIKPEKF